MPFLSLYQSGIQTIRSHVLNTGHHRLPLQGTLSPSVTLQEVYADSENVTEASSGVEQ